LKGSAAGFPLSVPALKRPVPAFLAPEVGTDGWRQNNYLRNKMHPIERIKPFLLRGLNAAPGRWSTDNYRNNVGCRHDRNAGGPYVDEPRQYSVQHLRSCSWTWSCSSASGVGEDYTPNEHRRLPGLLRNEPPCEARPGRRLTRHQIKRRHPKQ